jgi:hypothetical protein
MMFATPKIVGFRAWTMRTGHFVSLCDIHMEPFPTYAAARNWVEVMRCKYPYYHDFARCILPEYASVAT